MPSHAAKAQRIGALIIAIWVGSTSVLAGQFNSLVVFGDSLSDVGNIAQATLGIYPGPYYHNNRFSNGSVLVEKLSVDLGLGVIQRSTEGGNDFAYGGARTFGTGGFDGIFIRDVDEQVTQFISTRAIDPKSLFIVYAGANDLLGGQTNPRASVNSLINDIGKLVAAGARQFLVPNLPPLGLTPRFNHNPMLAAQYNALSEQFNAEFDAALDATAASHQDLMFHRVDVATLFVDAINSPAAFGLSNVMDAAAPGLAPGVSSYDASQIAPNANEYLFWDDVHPTATVHAILAKKAQMLLVGLPGDYNNNGTVDAADYPIWRANLGSAAVLPNDDTAGVGYDDYERWKTHFGKSASSGGGASLRSAIPEPEALMLVFVMVTMLTCGRTVVSEFVTA